VVGFNGIGDNTKKKRKYQRKKIKKIERKDKRKNIEGERKI
jgi:hypothetical protein